MAVTPNSIVTGQIPFSWVCVTGAAVDPVTATGASVGGLANVLTPPASSGLINANGMRLTRITALPVAAQASVQVVYLFSSTNDGANLTLIDAQQMNTWTAAMTVEPAQVDFRYSEMNPLILAPGESLWVGPSRAQSICVYCEGTYF